VPADLEPIAQASPAALGTIYIALETRRLHEAMKPANEEFVPLRVSSLVDGQDSRRLGVKDDSLSHTSGQVFDIDYSGLPPAELECLRFVLDDLGWEGYLGFIDEGHDSVHISAACQACPISSPRCSVKHWRASRTGNPFLCLQMFYSRRHMHRLVANEGWVTTGGS
jgi:hypothetical protein